LIEIICHQGNAARFILTFLAARKIIKGHTLNKFILYFSLDPPEDGQEEKSQKLKAAGMLRVLSLLFLAQEK
jgi:hypothetical protein